MAAVELDIPHLSSYLSFPVASINTIVSSPTVELVKALLDKVSAQARAHELLQAEKIKLDVELENAIRTGESKTRLMKASVEKSLKEVAGLRQQLEAQGIPYNAPHTLTLSN